MHLVILGLLPEDIRICCTELLLIETVTELLPALCHLLVDFLLDLAEIILDEDIGTIALL